MATFSESTAATLGSKDPPDISTMSLGEPGLSQSLTQQRPANLHYLRHLCIVDGAYRDGSAALSGARPAACGLSGCDTLRTDCRPRRRLAGYLPVIGADQWHGAGDWRHHAGPPAKDVGLGARTGPSPILQPV